MKRLYQLLAAAVVALLVPAIVGTPTFAASTCDIGYTGPDSKNMCTSKETYKCAVENMNKITIKDSNNQVVASGSVTVSGNGTGGGAISGTATNNTNTTFTVTVNNGGGSGPGVCTATVIVPAKDTPETVQPTTPVAGGGGGAVVVPQALPATGSDSTLTVTAVIAGIASLIAGLSVAVVNVYRRLHTL